MNRYAAHGRGHHKSIAYSAFPGGNQIWKVDWLGKIFKNPHIDSENKYQVAISPCGELSTDSGELICDPRNPDWLNQRVIELGVGTLPAVSTGSLWLKRQILVATPPYDTCIRRVSICSDDITVIEAGKSIQVNGRSEYLIPPYIHAVGRSNLSAPCMAFRIGDDPYGLLIPPMELFRFYYAEDTNLARRLLSGPFSDVLHQLVDLGESGITDEGAFHVRLERGMRTDNARIAALLAGSPIAQRNAKEIWGSLSRNRANRNSRYLECLPPFEGDAEFHLAGVQFESWGRSRFLAFRIDRGTLKVPWEVTYRLKYDNHTEGEVPQDRPPAWRGNRPQIRTANGGNIEHGEEPDANQDSLNEEALKGRFICPVLPTREPKKITRFRSGARYAPAPDNQKLSTGQGTSGITSSGPVAILGESPAAESNPPYDFQSFTKVLSELRTTHRYKVRLIAPSESRTNTAEGPCWRLRPMDFHTNSSWIYIDREKRKLRHVFVVELHKGSGYFYLFEQERRPSTTESHSLLAVGSQDYAQIGLFGLRKIIETTAGNDGSWPNQHQITELTRVHIHHTPKRRGDSIYFAQCIAARLERL